MNKKIVAFSTVALMLVMPVAALAFNAGDVPNSTNTGISINSLIDILFSILWPLIVAFAIIMFILAAFMFFNAQGDPDKVADARQAVLWGVVGMVVALLAFAIPFIVRNTLNAGGANLGT